MEVLDKAEYYRQHKETVDTMTESILKTIEDTGAAIFTDLEKTVAGFSDDAMTWAPNNVVMWGCISPAAVVALSRLIGGDVIEVKAIHPLAYFIDGVYQDLPIARSFPEKPFKSPRWLPVEFIKAVKV